MTRQYFTFRPLIIFNKIMGVNYSFNNELNTIEGLSYKFVCDKGGDNRKLGYFEYSDDKYVEIVEETLLKYSYHEKSTYSAKEFMIESFGEENIETIEIVEDKVEFTLKEIILI